jgi:cyclic pyranopterin phosphate synthase
VKDPFGRLSPIEITPHEINRLAESYTQVGIKEIKINGVEPLLRDDLVDIIQRLSTIPEIEDISLTTNGTLLASKAEALKQAGLKRVNISLDSLVDETYTQITRTSFFEQAQKGFFAAKNAGLEPIKLNMVVLNGINSDHYM